MDEWSTGLVTANGLQVFYHRSGPTRGKPSLVLLHGITDNGLCWSRVARHLEAAYDVIMPDARGHGRTIGPVNGLAFDVLAQDVAALVQNLKLERPYLFGHSMGAMTALEVAANHPDLVSAAVLEDPPFRDHNPSPAERARLRENAQAGLAFRSLPLADRLARGRADNPGWSEEEILPWAEAKGEYQPEIMNSWLGGESSIPLWRETLSRVVRPLLLITGDTDRGSLVTAEAAQEASRLCRQCEVVHVSGAGHCIHRDRFAETMQVVLDFLGKH